VTPPRLAAWLVGRVAGREQAPYVLSDLAEELDLVARARGPSAARRWYWRQAILSAAPLLVTAPDRAQRLARLHVRDSLRFFVRAPLLSSMIVLTLALGIGANTAVFSVVDALLLRPLPYGAPDRLVSLGSIAGTTHV